MAYRKIDIETKVDAVSRVLRGGKVTAVAREMELDRNSLANWVFRAVTAMRSGMKRNALCGKGRTAGKEEISRRLQAQNARQEREIKELSATIRRLREGPVPPQCPKCGCARFYRNGFTMMDLETLLGAKRNGSNRKIPVQKFTCVNCGKYAHLKGNHALFHWVAGSKKGANAGVSVDATRDGARGDMRLSCLGELDQASTRGGRQRKIPALYA